MFPRSPCRRTDSSFGDYPPSLKLAPTSSVRRCQMFKENNVPYKANPSRDEQLGGSLYGCRNDAPCGSRVTSGGNSGMYLL